jgi:two-component system, OmpR family, sensor kinase
MRKLPILVRLTAAFAAATFLMLAAAAMFVYFRLRADLDDRVDASLRARALAAATAVKDGTDLRNVAVEDPEESFAQVISTGGVLQTAGSPVGAAVKEREVRRAQDSDLIVERALPGIDGVARILVVRYPSEEPTVLAVGQSLRDRNEALSSLVVSFLIGGTAALGFASLIGYAVARSGLAPVAAIRRRAGEISAGSDRELLPLPPARDEIRRLAETLNEMLGRLQDSYARERRFVDDASHELRTPLAVVQTDLEGALLAPDNSPEVREALTSALDETRRLIRLAEDLLVLARTAEGVVPIVPRLVAAHEVETWARHCFAGVAPAAGRSIEVQVASDVRVFADPERLRQVITNLVDNAVRHGRGVVRVEATTADGTTTDGTTLAVGDDGDGFPADFVPHALDRLSRATGTDRRAGAGIGLAIVDAIVRAHGGQVTVSAGRPAVVRVRFPGATDRA